jgi:hypothetical protein
MSWLFAVCFLFAGGDGNVVAVSNINFTEVQTEIASTVCGADDPTQILEVNGTGLALFDFDNDNDLDLFVVNAASLDDFTSGPGCRLYENNSTTNEIVFSDVTEHAKIQISTWANGVAIGDVDGDGNEDIYITCHGPNVLLMNNGDGTFRDTTGSARVGDQGWGTSAAFGDLDGDGDLDLYVCNYLVFNPLSPPARARYKSQSVLGGPHGMIPQADVVYENLGDGTFQDVTIQWGFATTPSFALNVAILDFTGDGFVDVFVGNDSMSNKFYVNTDDSKTAFTEIGLHAGVAINGDGAMQATMGIAIADVNDNQRPDIFTTNFSSDTNTLHLNDVSGFFDDRTKKYRLGLSSRSMLGWSCGFHDFDLDGDEDLLIVNGHVYPEATSETMDSERAQPMSLFERDSKGFSKHKEESSSTVFQPHRDRAAVFGDVDNDGDTDVIINQRAGAVRVLRNDAEHVNFLVIHLKGNRQNPKGLGASIHVLLNDGSILSRWNHDGSGFQSSASTPILVAVGERTPEQITVTWPDGTSQVMKNVPTQGTFIIQQLKPSASQQ